MLVALRPPPAFCYSRPCTMSVVAAHALSETKLYQRLLGLGTVGATLASQVQSLCDEAAARLRLFPAQHPQFTLHDEAHSLRVVTLMGAVLGPVADRLNEVELALLILSAYFHDQGMVVDAGDLAGMRDSDAWREHAAQWSVEHPNRAAVLDHLAEPLLVPEVRERAARAAAELDAAMLADFVRQRHGEKSAAFVMARYESDPRLVVHARSLARLLATLCRSHVLPPSSLTVASGFRIDELVGNTRVNVALVAFVLRLADILDFDRDRTPDPLYRAITFASGVSVLEWEKHRSVVGWEITSDRIAFAAECTHPAYERAIRQFVAWIDAELRAAREWSRGLPQAAEGHSLMLPASVDVSSVGARVDPVSGQPEYLYRDLEFTLARDELVKLLMTNNLYSESGLFVRELLQNGLDALRHRQALFRLAGLEPPNLEVWLEHEHDGAGFDVVRCTDNGVGMDLGVVSAFLTRAGRSFYRSPEFELERARFKQSGCDFDPCARFGIGFMSCFTFGDEITVRTRRDYGAGRDRGDPLVIHVTGLGGIIEIRPGASDQPIGSSIEIRARKRRIIVDEWDDPVRLVSVVEGYALATEFPIHARSTVPGIAGAVDVATTCQALPYPVESLPISGRRLFRVDPSEADPRLRGELRLCTLADADGVVTTETGEARVRRKRGAANVRPRRIAESFQGHEVDLEDQHLRTQVCADGILVAGEPGRQSDARRHLGSRSSSIHLGGISYILDVRGNLKPTLTPARTPPEHSFPRDHSWRRLQRVADAAYGRLLADVLDACKPEDDPARFWTVAGAYDLDIAALPLDVFWKRVRLPVRRPGQRVEWRSPRELGHVHLRFPISDATANTPGVDATADEVADRRGPWRLELAEGAELWMPPEVTALSDEEHLAHSGDSWLLRQLLVACSTARATGPLELLLTPTPPGAGSLRAGILGEPRSALYGLRFADTESHVLRVAGESAFINTGNAIVAHARDAIEMHSDTRTTLDEFYATLCWAWPPLATSEAASTGSWPARTREKLGQLYSAIGWDELDTLLRPPFHAFVPGFGVQAITAADLTGWFRGTRV